MRILKNFCVKLFLFAPVVLPLNLIAVGEDFSAQALKDKVEQTFEIDSELARENEAWRAEREKLLAKIESLKTLNSALESKISEAEKNAQKSAEFNDEILKRLKSHSDFEKLLATFADKSSQKFTTQIPKNINGDILDFSAQKCDSFQSVYAYWAHLINYRISLLEKSQSLGVVYQNSNEKPDSRKLRIGLFALIDASENRAAAEICDMLEGKKPLAPKEIELVSKAKK